MTYTRYYMVAGQYRPQRHATRCRLCCGTPASCLRRSPAAFQVDFTVCTILPTGTILASQGELRTSGDMSGRSRAPSASINSSLVMSIRFPLLSNDGSKQTVRKRSTLLQCRIFESLYIRKLCIFHVFEEQFYSEYHVYFMEKNSMYLFQLQRSCIAASVVYKTEKNHSVGEKNEMMGGALLALTATSGALARSVQLPNRDSSARGQTGAANRRPGCWVRRRPFLVGRFPPTLLAPGRELAQSSCQPVARRPRVGLGLQTATLWAAGTCRTGRHRLGTCCAICAHVVPLRLESELFTLAWPRIGPLPGQQHVTANIYICKNPLSHARMLTRSFFISNQSKVRAQRRITVPVQKIKTEENNRSCAENQHWFWQDCDSEGSCRCCQLSTS